MAEIRARIGGQAKDTRRERKSVRHGSEGHREGEGHTTREEDRGRAQDREGIEISQVNKQKIYVVVSKKEERKINRK